MTVINKSRINNPYGYLFFRLRENMTAHSNADIAIGGLLIVHFTSILTWIVNLTGFEDFLLILTFDGSHFLYSLILLALVVVFYLFVFDKYFNEEKFDKMRSLFEGETKKERVGGWIFIYLFYLLSFVIWIGGILTFILVYRN